MSRRAVIADGAAKGSVRPSRATLRGDAGVGRRETARVVSPVNAVIYRHDALPLFGVSPERHPAACHERIAAQMSTIARIPQVRSSDFPRPAGQCFAIRS
jgi:hypothetical protein